MAYEQTLELLKPIMLDGSEKVGDRLYFFPFGEVEITAITIGTDYSIHTNIIGPRFTINGYNSLTHSMPTLFKCNPFEWLASRNNNQERIIEVLQGNKWLKRVLVKTTKANHALCWSVAETIEDAINEREVHIWHVWREVPTQKLITKQEALQMLEEKGVDISNLIIE